MVRNVLRGALTLVFAPWGGGGVALGKKNSGAITKGPAKILAPSSPV